MRVQEQIVELLGLPERGVEAPSLDRIEDTLTEGYAHALALDAERLRLERRIGEVARDADGRNGSLADELTALTGRLESVDGELVRLRTLLDPLRDRARALRSAAPR